MPRIRRILVAGATAVLAFGVVTSPSPAAADVSIGYIDADPGAQNDFQDEATLWTGSQYWNSNAVGVLQNILDAEDLLDKTDIDCAYGGVTVSAVKTLQRRLGFTGADVDGVVGRMTWGRIDNRLVVGAAYSNSHEWIHYRTTIGSTRTKMFLRARTSHGTYLFRYWGIDTKADWKQALYRPLGGSACR
ncbi:peptidoglycan-binding domain-containing protein [Streptomyces sp. NPDC002845]